MTTTDSDSDSDTVKTHRWERAGLGRAPYKFLGMSVEIYQAVPSDPNCPIQPGTSCDYCGQGISNVFHFKSANGKVFKVGCDCALKSGDKVIIDAAKRAENRRLREQKAERDSTRITKARHVLPKIAEKLRAQPHPTAWRTAKGETLLTWVEWMFIHAGTKGKLEAAKIVEEAMAESLTTE